MNKNYYKEIIKEINNNIKNKEYEKAFEILNNELKAPYIPNDVENEFNNLYQQLKPFIFKKTIKNLSKEEIINIFNNFIEYDIDYLVYIANYMNNFFWLNQKQWFVNLLNNKNLSNNVKIFLFNVLQKQKIDEIFEINNIKLNPLKCIFPFENDYYENLFYKIQNYFTKEPIINEIASSLLVKYIINSFPLCLFKNIDIEIEDLIKIASLMIKSNEEKTNLDKLNNKQKEILEIINKENKLS